MKSMIITPMPRSRRHPYTRWATTRPDGYGRPIILFCEALRYARDMV